jgi:hypothetical protein
MKRGSFMHVTSRLPKVAAVVAAVTTLAFAAGPASAAPRTILVPDDFVPALSDTRSGGHYEVAGTGLRIWTDSNTGTDKVAEYLATSTPLAELLAPSAAPFLEYTNSSGGAPGYQLVVDFDSDGYSDGILVGEPGVYGDDWWLNNAAKEFVKVGAPNTGGGSGSTWFGTLAEWDDAFPDATVQAFGFSLGSGVKGEGILHAINFAGDRYTFKVAVVLTHKEQCKDGGWATSTSPVFKNQGQCVSYFAKQKP